MESIANKILYGAARLLRDSVLPVILSAMPNDVRAARPVLDDTDRAILAVLSADARTPNNAIAEAVGIAPSTCLARIRTLRERGVIRGFHADIDPTALGRGLQAMIAVRLRAHTRERVQEFMRDVPGLPDVVGVWHVAGADDYLLHIAVADSDALRDFVLEHLTTHPAVGHTETSLIFGHLRGAVGATAPVTDQTPIGPLPSER
ncbi:transcriptional regulator, AsnC family [Catenulispora acidiphila DSM 44928]|uniref:Transcriptional regulator, AsnC family n=2 Tax=Catenulispora TaxID=414878 RepID=C7QAS6_CATAD|nr:transcriptional regulator, AsnC family [Catenulispora acidiphila DSM 44928]